MSKKQCVSAAFAVLLSAAASADHIIIDMTAAPASQQIVAGALTQTWEYDATLVSGREDTLTEIPDSYLGPTINVRTGDHVTINMHNQLAYEHTTHWHGLDIPEDADGHPMDAMGPGGTYTYDFIVRNRAGTYWYHPHPDMMTGEQVYRGLAGFFIVTDDAEQALDLPRGDQDIALCLQDIELSGSNQLTYAPNAMMGFFGSTLVVNGTPGRNFDVATRAHRVRVLNGSQSRIYKLAFDDNSLITVIASGGGMLESPKQLPYLMLGPGERSELWVDFTNKSVGDVITLRTLSFSGAGNGQGETHNLCTFTVVQQESETIAMPASFGSIGETLSVSDVTSYKTWPISMIGMDFVINGGLFSMYYAAPNEQAVGGEVNQITITNSSGMMLIAHPMHFHGRQFQIVSRTVASAGQVGWDTVRYGYLDDGWKDTFVIMPHETVKYLVRWGKHPGLFMYHCHNLVHEDMGMMRNFNVTAPPCPADMNHDDMVGVDDLLQVLSGWGTPFGDANGDDMTDVNDVLAIISGWGGC